LSSAYRKLRYETKTRSLWTVTPRCRNRAVAVAPPLGSNFQISFPFAASTATTFNVGVVAYSTPSMTMGLLCISDAREASCES
jgi:hypothetical protein